MADTSDKNHDDTAPKQGAGGFDISHFRVTPDGALDLAAIDPQETPFWDPDDKDGGKELVKDLNDQLEDLQELLWAEHKHRVLVVLQAMDAGGKDSTISHVFDGVNPSGVRVAAFKKPSAEELAHDYLWRAHKEVPADGELVIFNRSHYEDVLVVRVNELVPEERWSKRYDHIVNFEKMLADEGTTIIKFFLHISKEEQRERFQARLDEPDKNWKFEPADMKARAQWDDYQLAFTDALSRTSKPWAPWYVVPANRKWYRNIVVSQVMVQTLRSLNMQYPEAAPDIASTVIPD